MDFNYEPRQVIDLKTWEDLQIEEQLKMECFKFILNSKLFLDLNYFIHRSIKYFGGCFYFR